MNNSIPTSLTSQVTEDYLSYSMAVLVGRAIPDLYDGLKPVQRRILLTMAKEGLAPDKRYVKCARVTGLTMAFYHPHSGAYGALVNMSTAWSNNVPWVDGHGNFGSTTDGPAAERYTECKLRPAAMDLLLQDQETWELRDNYDGSRKEAVRFNAAVPTVLLNGDSGIAVGFATKLAPHNLREITAAISDLKKAKDLTPDFPTGCNIVADEELERYKQTGSGNIRCRALLTTGIQKRDGRAKDRPTLTFTNFPPGVNPEKLGEQIKNCLENGRINGIAEIIDESDISGDRLTIASKIDSGVDRLPQLLYHYTDLDTRYAARTLVIDGVKPVELNPAQVLAKWGEWRLAVLERKFRFELDRKESRLEIVMGFLKAIEKIDSIIKLIRESQSKSEALIKLVDRPHKFTKQQATAILDMRLHQLTKLDANDMATEKIALCDAIEELKVLITDEKERNSYMLKEIKSIGVRHGEKRRCEIIAPPEIITIEKGVAKREPTVSRPRFMKVDTKRGVAEQVKGPRGALVLDSKDKVVLMTEDGALKKVAANFKGMVSSKFNPIVLAKREAEVSQKKYLVVFSLEDTIKAMVLNGIDLCKSTSKGKSWLPENSTLLHFGENNYTVNWKSSRKKPLTLDLQTKIGRPGGKGIKIADACDIAG